MTGDRPLGGPPPPGRPPRGRRLIRRPGAIDRRKLTEEEALALLSKPLIEGTTGIAAPVLAGFSLALIGVIAQDPTHFRWPGATLAALTIPIFCLLYAVRVGARARGIAGETNYDKKVYEILSRRTVRMYGIGICSLWACIAMTVAPPLSGEREVAFRWAAFALAIAASAVEAVWTTSKLWSSTLARIFWAEINRSGPER
jgi:hypothetical protein